MTVETRFGKWPDTHAKFVRATEILDYDDSFVKKQANELVRDSNTLLQAVKSIYAFVSLLPEGSGADDRRASQVLRRQKATCAQRTVLFAALTRAAGIPVRMHAWQVRRGAIRERLLPKRALLILPEVHDGKQWRSLASIVSQKGIEEMADCPFRRAAIGEQPAAADVLEDLGVFWHPEMVFGDHGTNQIGWRSLLRR